MKKEQTLTTKEIKDEFGLTQLENRFCDLFVNGGSKFAGQHCKCYKEVYGEDINASLKSRRLLSKSHISNRIKKLIEEQQNDTETIAVKLQVTETLRAIMEETATSEYKDKWGQKLSPAPLRAVSVNAAKALMDLYPIKHAQESKVRIEGAGEGGVIFNVIVPQNTTEQNEKD